MKAGHTPGPWRVGDAGHTVFGPPNGAPAPERVATIHGGTADMAAVTRAFIMKDNARLIAAAPELLEELKAEHSEYIRRRAEDDGYPHKIEGCTVCALIAKAEGRE
jgi:hypothetical protein